MSGKVSFHTNPWICAALLRPIRIQKGGAEGQDRTVDTRFFRPVLYQLSYLGDPRRSVTAAPPSTYAVCVNVVAIGGSSSQRSSTNALTRCTGPQMAS